MQKKLFCMNSIFLSDNVKKLKNFRIDQVFEPIDQKCKEIQPNTPIMGHLMPRSAKKIGWSSYKKVFLDAIASL